MVQQIQPIPPDLPSSLRCISATDHHVFSIDPPRRHMRMDIVGFWAPNVATSFGENLRRAIDILVLAGVAYGTMRTMIDVRKALIMPQDLVETLQKLAAEHGHASERVSFLCSSTLQKMQYQRIAPSPMFSHFLDEFEARSWLFSD